MYANSFPLVLHSFYFHDPFYTLWKKILKRGKSRPHMLTTISKCNNQICTCIPRLITMFESHILVIRPTDVLIR